MSKTPVILLVAAVLVAGILYFSLGGSNKVDTVEEALEAVTSPTLPSIDAPRNPVEDAVPNLNPVERTNPFRYKNPFE